MGLDDYATPCSPVSLRKDLIALSKFLEGAARNARVRVDKDARQALLEAAVDLFEGATRAMSLAATELTDEEREAVVLTAENRSGNARGMVTAERVRHSKGTKKRDALVVAANAKNYTLRSLAEALKAEKFEVTHSLLSQARPDEKGHAKRSIDGKLAKRIEELTGFPATKRNWPRLRS